MVMDQEWNVTWPLLSPGAIIVAGSLFIKVSLVPRMDIYDG